MCGFAGLVGFGGLSYEQAQLVAIDMGNAISHRGPDDSDIWCSFDSQVAMVHRRLAIVDLSEAGKQPMRSKNGRYIIVFNGEVYNHHSLRQELQNSCPAGWHWVGRSDTETLLAGFDFWGIEGTLKKSIGMFAMAIWDTHERLLHLARDRMGEKPLYYGWQGKTFLFGSELKALKKFPGFEKNVDRNALTLYMRHNYIPAPYSIYTHIKKLEPGTILSLSMLPSAQNFQVTKYWTLDSIAQNGFLHPLELAESEATNHLENLLKSAVSQQMVADVPLGAFLSGGIDSSTIASLMQAQSSIPIKTFTIGFHEQGFDEAKYAHEVAKHLGTDHTELYVTPKQAQSCIPKLPEIYDEPFGDSSQIPTYLVSQMAKRDVTVALSGDAGDELFGGYNRYLFASNYKRRMDTLPRWLKHLGAYALAAIPGQSWDSLGRWAAYFLPKSKRLGNLGLNVYRLTTLLKSKNNLDFMLPFLTHWPAPASLVKLGWEDAKILQRYSYEFQNLEEQMMTLDANTYLPDDILVKVDRAAMANSLETRVPFLDHRVVEFAWRLPLSMKIQNGTGKKILRNVLYKYVPQALIDRPKMGFGIPLHAWLRGPLREWAESLLDEKRLSQEGFFTPAPIRAKWKQHVNHIQNWQYHLWDVLMFQAWLEREKEN